MLSRHTKLLQGLTTITKTFHSTQLEWNSKTGRIQHFRNNKRKNRKFLRAWALFTCTTIVLLAQSLHKYITKSESKQSVNKHKCYFFLEILIFGFGWISLVSIWVNLESTCRYINGVLDFADKYEELGTKLLPKHLDFINKQTEKFAYSTSPTCYLIPFLFYFVLNWNNPCTSSVAGYGLLPECGNELISTDNLLLNTTFKFILMLYNVYDWNFGISTTLFVAPVILMLCTVSLREYLEL